jgi:hypothetical protein
VLARRCSGRGGVEGRGKLERFLTGFARRAYVAQVSLDQRASREEEGAIGGLSGLQEHLLALGDVSERFAPISSQTLDVPQTAEHPGERELVVVLARLPHDGLALPE